MSNSSNQQSAVGVAYLLIFTSLFTNGVHFVSEEKLFDKYHLDPFLLVGTEGVWGLIFSTIVRFFKNI